jgi:hypothetical protein
VRSGEQLDPLTLTALARGGDAALASVGLTSEDLLRSTLQSLRAASPTDLGSIDDGMRLAKELVDSMPAPGDAAAIRRDASQLLDRNIRRIAGTVSGGYSNNPDFAELGRAIEQAELLAQLSSAGRTPATATPAAANAAADAAQGADTLTW